MSPSLKLNPPGPARPAPAPAPAPARAPARARRHVSGIDVLGNLAEVAPEGVVPAPRLRIGQDVVGLGDVLEPVLGPRVVVDVRVVGAGQLAVGALDVLLAGVPRHAQDLVEVLAVGHQPGPVNPAGHHHLRRPQLVVPFAVGGPDDLGHQVVLGAGVGPGGDGLVPGRVEPGAAVVAAGEAQAGQHVQGLVPDRPDPVDDGGRIGLGVRQGQIEVVDHGQPLPGHGGPGLLLGPADLRGASLAHVVQVGQGPQAQVLELGDPGRLLGDPGLELGARVGGRVSGRRRFPAAWLIGLLTRWG